MSDSKVKILIFDDEELVGTIIGKILDHFGCESVHAFTVTEAIDEYQQAQRKTEPFTAVLADLNIAGNGESGIDFVQKLSALGNILPVFAMTGNVFEEPMQNPHKYGFTGVLAKPIDLNVIEGFLAKL